MKNPGIQVFESELLDQAIAKVATGVTRSRDLDRDEAQGLMQAILSPDVDPVKAAVALIALRMKHETADELLGLQDALIMNTTPVDLPVDEVLVLSSPYDGVLRSRPLSVLLAPMLAAAGVACITHDGASIGPKWGLTHTEVLSDVAYRFSTDAAAVVEAVQRCGWAHLRPAQFCAGADGLIDLRNRMIKRTALATLDRLHLPVRARKATHLFSGYVHKAYPELYLQLASNAGYASAGIVKGYEGGLLPAKTADGVIFHRADFSTDRKSSSTFGVSDFGLHSLAIPKRESTHTRDEVIAALRRVIDDVSMVPDSLFASAALGLWTAGACEDLQEGVALARDVIRTGAAKERFESELCSDHRS